MRNRLFSLIITSVAAGLATSLASAAQVPSTPSLKPQLVAASDVISTRDAGLLRQGLQAVDRSDWFEVRQAESQLRDTTARDILTWYRARRDWRMSFDEMDRALTAAGRLAGNHSNSLSRRRSDGAVDPGFTSSCSVV